MTLCFDMAAEKVDDDRATAYRLQRPDGTFFFYFESELKIRAEVRPYPPYPAPRSPALCWIGFGAGWAGAF